MPPSLQSQTHEPSHPLAVYERCVSEGKLNNDDAQRQVISKLEALYLSLAAYSRRGFLRSLLHWRRNAAPRSIYIWGAVGRGKSLLMDMFYDCVNVQKKRRIHFHAFMQEVHAAAHVLRQKIESGQLKTDLMQGIANDIASKTHVLCLDELQVTDVADAMILSKLFTGLLANGVTVVITSNRPPEELYLGGLQRELFLNFIHLLTSRTDVLQLVSPNDYRMEQIRALRTVYMYPLSDETEQAFQHILVQLTHQAELLPMTLDVQGRKLTIPQSYGGIACFDFAELCEKPLGAADYFAIAKRFHSVFVRNIPKLIAQKRNEAKRFVTFIDMLYDHRVKLICTAAVKPAELYVSGDGTFEFQRLVSRLAEMQSQQYLDTPHIP